MAVIASGLLALAWLGGGLVLAGLAALARRGRV